MGVLKSIDELPIDRTERAILMETFEVGKTSTLVIHPEGLDYGDEVISVPCGERFRLTIEQYNSDTQQWEYYATTWFILVADQLTASFVLDTATAYRFTISIYNKCGRVDYIYTGISATEFECDGTLVVELVEVQHVTCNGLSNGIITIDVAGGTGPYTFAWSNGATTQDLNGVGAGEYSVVVTDANGCIARLFESVVVTEPDPVLFAYFTRSANAGCNGNFTLVPIGGDGNYTVTITTGAGVIYTGTDLIHNNLCPDNYDVYVSDGNGCGQTRTITIYAT